MRGGGAGLDPTNHPPVRRFVRTAVRVTPTSRPRHVEHSFRTKGRSTYKIHGVKMTTDVLQDELQRLVLHAIWPSLQKSHLNKDVYGRIGEHLASKLQVLAVRTTLPVATLLDLLVTVKQNANSIPELLLNTLNEKIEHLQHPPVQNSGRLAQSLIDIWLTLMITLPEAEALIWQPTIPWTEGKLLRDAVEVAFTHLKSSPTTGDLNTSPIVGTIPSHLTMVYLIKNHGWDVRWSSNLLEHLKIDSSTNTIRVYEHKVSLFHHLQDPDSTIHFPVPKPILEESLDTLNLLFPPEDAATQDYLTDRRRPFHSLGLCGRPEERKFEHYDYWQKNLYQLAEELKKPRRGLRQLTVDPDQRNLVDVVTFWVAAILAVALALGFGIASTYFSAKSYWIGVAQYELALAQACAAEGANVSLSTYCS